MAPIPDPTDVGPSCHKLGAKSTTVGSTLEIIGPRALNLCGLRPKTLIDRCRVHCRKLGTISRCKLDMIRDPTGRHIGRTPLLIAIINLPCYQVLHLRFQPSPNLPPPMQVLFRIVLAWLRSPRGSTALPSHLSVPGPTPIYACRPANSTWSSCSTHNNMRHVALKSGTSS